MLVILSDLHFTDASIGEKSNIPARAFTYLAEHLHSLAGREVEDKKRDDIQDLDVVLLGDVFDLLRSDKWEGELLPWSEDLEALQTRTGKIMDGVCEINSKALEAIRGIKSSVGLPPENVRIHYVPGNHDRLVNMFQPVRAKAAEALGLQPEQYDVSRPFPPRFQSTAHGLLARHGNQFDSLNWGGDFNRPGLGEAVVVKLMNAFPVSLRHVLEASSLEGSGLLEKVVEIDHVRPLWAVPRWLKSIVAHTPEPELRRALKQAWEETVVGFLKDDFVKRFTGGWNPFRATRWLPSVLRSPWGLVEKIFEWGWVRRRMEGLDHKYALRASRESTPGGKEEDIGIIAYGHTHIARQILLDVSKGRRRIYFNTGTWRKMVRPVEHDPEGNREFIPLQVMSYVVLYKKSENRGYRYETWSGMRGS